MQHKPLECAKFTLLNLLNRSWPTAVKLGLDYSNFNTACIIFSIHALSTQEYVNIKIIYLNFKSVARYNYIVSVLKNPLGLYSLYKYITI